jgi:hypothetical protein
MASNRHNRVAVRYLHPVEEANQTSHGQVTTHARKRGKQMCTAVLSGALTFSARRVTSTYFRGLKNMLHAVDEINGRAVMILPNNAQASVLAVLVQCGGSEVIEVARQIKPRPVLAKE